MSTRGRPPDSAPRPITPPDPSLVTRPVPSHRAFRPTFSFGQGTRSDLPFKSVAELDNLPEADPASSNQLVYHRSLDSVLDLIELTCDQEFYINSHGIPGPTHTWGFWVFVTEYSPFTLEKIPRAMENLVKVTESYMDDSVPAYSNEAARRFKLDVIINKEALESASDDRVREEFKSFLRQLRLMNKDREEDQDRPDPMLGSTMVCLVLDKNAIDMLTDLEFGKKDTMKDYDAFKGKNIKVIAILWVRGSTEWPDSDGPPYRGVDACPIVFLRYLYYKLSHGAEGGVMEDIFPMQTTCY